MAWSLSAVSRKRSPPVLPGDIWESFVAIPGSRPPHQLPCKPVCSIKISAAYCPRTSPPTACWACRLPDLHCGPLHQEVPNPVPGGVGSGVWGPVKAERGEEGGLFRCLFSQPSVCSFAHSFIQHTTGCLWVQVDLRDGPVIWSRRRWRDWPARASAGGNSRDEWTGAQRTVGRRGAAKPDSGTRMIFES